MKQLNKSAVLGAVVCAVLVLSPAFANPQAGQKPVVDCSKIRGVCYGICPEETVRRELAYGTRVGLNTVRFWLSRIAYAKAGDRYVKQVVDFVRTCHACGYKSMPILFNLIIEGRCFDEHGIFYPDGTIRDAGTIAAMFGCFRNRGEKCAVIPPNPNREGQADRALKLIRTALDDNTKASTFANRKMDKKPLLDACEVAANLLEACELVPMCDLPTTKIAAFRKDTNADIWEIRKFAYTLARHLKEVCQIVDD